MGMVRDIAREVRRTAFNVRDVHRRRAFPKSVQKVWAQVRAEQLSYTSEAQLQQLLRIVRDTNSSGGLIIEAGCARGGSAILICATKSKDRPMRVYDVFDMIPPPSEKDGADMKSRYAEIVAGKAVGIDGGTYYLYERDMQAMVTKNFERLGYPIDQNNVMLIKGKVQDTLVVEEPVALANIDVDWYEPVMACLERIVPRLVPGGAVALRAYSDWSGCRRAADEYFNRIDRRPFTFDKSAGHLLVTRSAAG